jgi:hypothetical protein
MKLTRSYPCPRELNIMCEDEEEKPAWEPKEKQETARLVSG